MVFHAGLDAPAAGLNAGAFLLGVGLAGFGYRYIGDQRSLAGRRELAEVLLDARLEPALAGLDLAAELLDIRCAGLMGGTQLSHCASRHQQQRCKDKSRDVAPHPTPLPARGARENWTAPIQPS